MLLVDVMVFVVHKLQLAVLVRVAPVLAIQEIAVIQLGLALAMVLHVLAIQEIAVIQLGLVLVTDPFVVVTLEIVVVTVLQNVQ